MMAPGLAASGFANHSSSSATRKVDDDARGLQEERTLTDGIAAQLFKDRAPRSLGFAQTPTVAALRLELCGAVWCLPGFSDGTNFVTAALE